jgi:hypothetical protein
MGDFDLFDGDTAGSGGATGGIARNADSPSLAVGGKRRSHWTQKRRLALESAEIEEGHLQRLQDRRRGPCRHRSLSAQTPASYRCRPFKKNAEAVGSGAEEGEFGRPDQGRGFTA